MPTLTLNTAQSRALSRSQSDLLRSWPAQEKDSSRSYWTAGSCPPPSCSPRSSRNLSGPRLLRAYTR